MRSAAEVVGELVRQVLACDEALNHVAVAERQREFERYASKAARGSMGCAVATAIAEKLARVAEALR